MLTTPERVLEHADDVSLVVLAWERDRKLKRLDTRVRNGDEHLRPFRDRRLAKEVTALEEVRRESEERRVLLERMGEELAAAQRRLEAGHEPAGDAP